MKLAGVLLEGADLVELAQVIGLDKTFKALGIESMAEGEELTGQSKQSLRNWFLSDKINKQQSFRAVLLGAAEIKRRSINAS